MNRDKKPLPSLDDLQREIEAMNPKGGEEGESGPSRATVGQALRLSVELVAWS